MDSEFRVSIIVPAYNSEKTIEYCLKTIIDESKNFESEIIVIDDNSSDKTSEIVKKFNSVKLVKLEKNSGAGNARNLGAKIAKHETLCFVDSDLIISKKSILNLVKILYRDKSIGSALATQELSNLNDKSWSSNFVCLKSCYGFEYIEKEIEFSVCCSEFCVISKELFNKTGGWKPLRNAGGEEFDLGYKINKLNKKNIKTKEATYKGYWCNLYIRFKRIIDRTEKYLPLFFKKRKFDTKGSFATSNQALSSTITFLYLLLISLYFILNKHIFMVGLIILFVIQIIIEFRFLIFAKRYFGLRMLFFSLFGIQVINVGILIGIAYFFLNMIKKPSSDHL